MIGLNLFLMVICFMFAGFSAADEQADMYVIFAALGFMSVGVVLLGIKNREQLIRLQIRESLEEVFETWKSALKSIDEDKEDISKYFSTPAERKEDSKFWGPDSLEDVLEKRSREDGEND